MRRVALMIAVLALSGCAGGAAPDGGVATYDALRQAQAACAAKGGALQLKTMGDSQNIEDYACKRN